MTSKKKIKLLILCFDYQPLNSIGALRPHAWRKYFARNNIQTTIITRNWNSKIQEPKDFFEKDIEPEIDKIDELGRIIKLNYKGNFKRLLFSNERLTTVIRKSFSLLQQLFKWSIPFFDEKYFIYLGAKNYIKKNNVDLILTTGEPYILFKYAHDLGKRNNIPFVIDYRDGWNTNHVKKNWLFTLINNIERKRENKYLKGALFACAASPKIIKDNISIFKNDKFYLHENGVDLDLLNDIKKDVEVFKKFTICYTGSIYLQHNVSAFIGAFRKIKEMGHMNIQFLFIGIKLKFNNQVQKLIELSKDYEEDIIIYDTMPHKECIKFQLQSHLLLKFDFTGQKDNLLGAKLYEYAATKKPILTILSNSDKITYFYPGKNVQYMANTEEEIINEINKIYNAHQKFNDVKNELTDSEIMSFSREKKIKDLSILIHEKLKI